MADRISLKIYIDGGCEPNPGLGAWAYAVYRVVNDVLEGQPLAYEAKAVRETTNNRMELTGALEALRWVEAHPEWLRHPKIIVSDSKYLLDGLGWSEKWESKGWMLKKDKPVKNVDLWQDLRAEKDKLFLSWSWVRGHTGVVGNEFCDFLANEAMTELMNRPPLRRGVLVR